jgi:hypothetical protein
LRSSIDSRAGEAGTVTGGAIANLARAAAYFTNWFRLGKEFLLRAGVLVIRTIVDVLPAWRRVLVADRLIAGLNFSRSTADRVIAELAGELAQAVELDAEIAEVHMSPASVEMSPSGFVAVLVNDVDEYHFSSLQDLVNEMLDLEPDLIWHIDAHRPLIVHDQHDVLDLIFVRDDLAPKGGRSYHRHPVIDQHLVRPPAFWAMGSILLVGSLLADALRLVPVEAALPAFAISRTKFLFACDLTFAT